MWERIRNHVTREWSQEDYVHPAMKLFPPFAYEAMVYIIIFIVIADQILKKV